VGRILQEIRKRPNYIVAETEAAGRDDGSCGDGERVELDTQMPG
jgi:hypothetical protein